MFEGDWSRQGAQQVGGRNILLPRPGSAAGAAQDPQGERQEDPGQARHLSQGQDKVSEEGSWSLVKTWEWEDDQY